MSKDFFLIFAEAPSIAPAIITVNRLPPGPVAGRPCPVPA
jgi:hypothetical protein